jgi:hypothetical protein
MSAVYKSHFALGSNESNLLKLGNASDFHPLDHENVPFVIKAGSVWADKTTDRELVASLLPEILPAIEAHLPKVGNNLIALVNDRHVREEIGNDEQALAFVSRWMMHSCRC